MWFCSECRKADGETYVDRKDYGYEVSDRNEDSWEKNYSLFMQYAVKEFLYNLSLLWDFECTWIEE